MAEFLVCARTPPFRSTTVESRSNQRGRYFTYSTVVDTLISVRYSTFCTVVRDLRKFLKILKLR
eukprot:SAG11_NODE_29_length_23137_cov_16.739995_20_plen_64_part_00